MLFRYKSILVKSSHCEIDKNSFDGDESAVRSDQEPIKYDNGD